MTYEDDYNNYKEQQYANPLSDNELIAYMEAQGDFFGEPSLSNAQALDNWGPKQRRRLVPPTDLSAEEPTPAQESFVGLKNEMNYQEPTPLNWNQEKEEEEIQQRENTFSTHHANFLEEYKAEQYAKIKEAHDGHKQFMEVTGTQPLSMLEFAKHNGFLDKGKMQEAFQKYMENVEKETAGGFDFDNYFAQHINSKDRDGLSDLDTYIDTVPIRAFHEANYMDPMRVAHPEVFKYAITRAYPSLDTTNFEDVQNRLYKIYHDTDTTEHTRMAMKDYLLSEFTPQILKDDNYFTSETAHPPASDAFGRGDYEEIGKIIASRPEMEFEERERFDITMSHIYKYISEQLPKKYLVMGTRNDYLPTIFFRHFMNAYKEGGLPISHIDLSDYFRVKNSTLTDDDYDPYLENEKLYYDAGHIKKYDIQEYNPEEDELSSLRVIPTRNLSTFDIPQIISYGGTGPNLSNAIFEEGVKANAVRGNHRNLPGVLEGEPVSGTWVMPKSRKALANPDVSFMQGLPTALLGITNPDLDWWRTPEEGANATEGFQYEGFDSDDFRRIPILDDTSLYEMRYGAAGRPEKGSSHNQKERMRGVHNILSDMQMPWNLKDDTAAWHQGQTRSPVTENLTGRKVAGEPMEMAMRLLKALTQDQIIPRVEHLKGEAMRLPMRLLKDRISPEAKQHKLDYDKKYESTPVRVKYREALNQERRKRGIYGARNHKDISHTEGGKLTLEGEHENRARHFKDKGTLRRVDVKKAVQHTLPSYSPQMVNELQKPESKTIYIASKPGSGHEGMSPEMLDDRHNAMLEAISRLNTNHDFTIHTGQGMSPWGGEHTIILQGVPENLEHAIQTIAVEYGQEAIAQSDEGEKGVHFLDPITGERGDEFRGQEFQESPEYYTTFPTGQKLTFTP